MWFARAHEELALPDRDGNLHLDDATLAEQSLVVTQRAEQAAVAERKAEQLRARLRALRLELPK